MFSGVVSSAIFSTQRRRCLLSLRGRETFREGFEVIVDIPSLSRELPFAARTRLPSGLGPLRACRILECRRRISSTTGIQPNALFAAICDLYTRPGPGGVCAPAGSGGDR